MTVWQSAFTAEAGPTSLWLRGKPPGCRRHPEGTTVVNRVTEAVSRHRDSIFNAVPLLGGSHWREDYEQALEMVERLIDTDDENPLIDLLAKKIADYENTAPEFEAFNARIAALPQELAMLRAIMDQHGLNQSSFKEEIGSSSLVSMILKGKRKLTLEHMKALAKRFGLPVSAFIDEKE